MSSRWIPWLAVLLVLGCSRQESRWSAARAEDTPAAYQSYISDYPAGSHVEAARARMRELQEEQDWQRALRLATPEALQRYLAAHPEGRNAAAARERLGVYLGADRPSAPALPAWSAQLGAFSSRAAAAAAWSRLAALQPGLLAGREAAIVEASGALWRLRVGVVGEGDARELCAELVARGEACAAALE